jgi:hypothetical protein
MRPWILVLILVLAILAVLLVAMALLQPMPHSGTYVVSPHPGGGGVHPLVPNTTTFAPIGVRL